MCERQEALYVEVLELRAVAIDLNERQFLAQAIAPSFVRSRGRSRAKMNGSSRRSSFCRIAFGGELLFNLITDRYERRATVVTTNLSLAGWVTVFAGDEKLTTARLDRLAHHAAVVITKGKSYRMRKRRAPE